MPIVMVVRLEGQLPQAPCRRRYTTGPSISTNSTLPPSDMRYGRICRSPQRPFALTRVPRFADASTSCEAALA